MAGRRAQGRGRGLLPLVLAVLALLMQVNAPVARAAARADGSTLCHDSPGQSRRDAPPTPSDKHCLACVVCCAAPAAAMPRAEVAAVPTPPAAVRIVARPELEARFTRGPPRLRPPVRGPPAALA